MRDDEILPYVNEHRRAVGRPELASYYRAYDLRVHLARIEAEAPYGRDPWLPRIWRVVLRDRSYYVVGLPTWDGRDPDTYLLYRYTHPESETPDVDSPSDHHRMHGALYDLLQRTDGLVDGDRFETPFGDFVCDGVHVVPAKTEAV